MRNILVLSMAVLALLIAGCIQLPEEEEEDELELDTGYSGTLTISYRRDFPSVSAKVEMNVDIAKNGEVTVGAGSSSSYEGDETKEIDGGRIRNTDMGSLTAGSGSAVTILRGSDLFVAISIKVHVKGEQETFAWDEEHMTWYSMAKIPYDVEDPIQPPVEFRVGDVALSPGIVSHTAPQAFGSVTYSWSLLLMASG